MGRHQRIIRVNPYINRYGGRTRYMPNRAKDPARKSKRKPPMLFSLGPRKGSGRDAQTSQAVARRDQRQAEQRRTAARYGGALPKLTKVIEKVRERLLRPQT